MSFSLFRLQQTSEINFQHVVLLVLGLGGGPLGLLDRMFDRGGVVSDNFRVPEREAREKHILYSGVEAAEDDGLVTQGSDSLNFLTFS